MSRAREEMPVGVYLSWELAHAYAELNHKELRVFLDESLAICREHHVNTLWVTNIDAADLPIIQEVCSRYGIRLVANTCEGKAEGVYENDAAELHRQFARMAEHASDVLDCWIISDEPEATHVELLNAYVNLLGKADSRRHGVVLTAGQYANVIGSVPLDMAAVDPYPFFAPNDPNGPNTREASQAYYRGTGEGFVAACRKAGVEPWLMPQSFAEVWGPYEYDEEGMMIAQPGAYLHWITPTPVQMRWQVYESLRQGAQGIVFFQMLPTMVPDAGKNPCPDVPWKDVLAKGKTPVGYGALLTIYGKTTPQFDEIGDLFACLRRHASVLRGAVPAEKTAWVKQLPDSVRAASFVKPESHVCYTVLVNDDFEKKAAVRLEDKGLYDIAHGKKCSETIELLPGDGAVLVRKLKQ